jgi:homoserine kinase type II
MNEVQSLLAAYPADCQPTRIEPLGSAGGMSGAQFWRLATPRGLLLFRRWPAEFPPPKRLRFIHAVIRHAAARGCDFLPVPVTTQGGDSFVEHAGYLCELAPWMPGVADYCDQPSLEKLRAAMRALARFHTAAADYRCEPFEGINTSPAPVRHQSRLRDLTPARIRELSDAVTDRAWPELAPLARTFLANLPAAIPRAAAKLEPFERIALPMQPCLRDIWHDHVLFTGDEVTGIIDFGAVDIETPATDIARLLGSIPTSQLDRSQTWNEGIAAYSTARPLSDDEVGAAFALDFSNPILAGCNWIRWIYIEAREFDNRAQVVERFQEICRSAVRNT